MDCDWPEVRERDEGRMAGPQEVSDCGGAGRHLLLPARGVGVARPAAGLREGTGLAALLCASGREMPGRHTETSRINVGPG